MSKPKNHRPAPTPQSSHREEILNSITHGLGIPMALTALVLLWMEGLARDSTLYLVAGSIYGLSMLGTYTTSTLYHSFYRSGEKLRHRLHLADHSAIYIFIAGTYTPVALFVLPPQWGYPILAAVWLLALTGMVYKLFFLGRHQKLSLIIYLLMGWLIIIALKPLLEIASNSFLIWMLAGGLSYSVGTVFFSLRKMPFAHALWHLFVLGGSICHFVGIYLYL